MKKTPTFNGSIRGFEIFWWCWASFPTCRVTSLFNLQHVHRKVKQNLATCGHHGARVCFCLLWIYWRSNKLETHQVLLPLFCPVKDQFWFLLTLRTYSAEVFFFFFIWTETQIVQPQNSYKGDYVGKWEIFTISTYL